MSQQNDYEDIYGENAYRRASYSQNTTSHTESAYGASRQTQASRPQASRQPQTRYAQSSQRAQTPYSQASKQGQNPYSRSSRPSARTQASAQNRAYARGMRPIDPHNDDFDSSVYRDMSRYTTHKRRRRKSPVAAIIFVVALLACGVGAYLFLNPLSFDVTIDGVTHTVSRGTTLTQVLDEGYASPAAGNLLAIDGSIITQGGGELFLATVNGSETSDGNTELHKNDVVTFENGRDTTEDFTTTIEEVPYSQVEDSNYWSGSLHVYIQGQNGVNTIKTGAISGITLTEETTPVVDEGYRIYTADTGDDKVIALTFDDGPWDTTTQQILDVLAQYNAKATFFTIGNQVEEHSDVVKAAYNAGHQICTHTWDHASGTGQGVNLTYMSADEQIEEVEKGFSVLDEVLGVQVDRVMRAPGGNFSGDIVWTLEPYIVAEIGWNVDTEDWRRPGADSIAAQILSATAGDVVLMHDGGGDRSQTVEALKTALPQLVEQGYSFVTINELLAYGLPSDS